MTSIEDKLQLIKVYNEFKVFCDAHEHTCSITNLFVLTPSCPLYPGYDPVKDGPVHPCAYTIVKRRLKEELSEDIDWLIKSYLEDYSNLPTNDDADEEEVKHEAD